jgi:hypothetical protein
MRMIDERHNPETIIKFAEALLSWQFDQGARLVRDHVFSGFKSVVVRCRVESRGMGLPDALIVKKVREDRVGYFPNSQAPPNSARELFNDWAAARFLDGIGHDPPLSPRFYAGDRENGLIVLEDLGDGEAPNTMDALQGRDPQLAEQTLVENAALLGQLHAATMGRYEEYRKIRLELGPAPHPLKLYHDPWSEARLSPIPASEIDEAISSYRATLAALGLRPQPGVEEEIAHVTTVVEADPGPFLAYCKGDQNVAGDYIRRLSKPRLFDFDQGGFRHALIEGMPGRMTWGCQMRIPARIQSDMERAYQAALSRGYAEVADDRVFYRGMVEAAARWNILHLIHRVPSALSGDYQRGLTTLRQQVVAWLEAFADLSDERQQLKALGKSAREAVKRLRELWPAEVCSLPYYPAFRVI